MNVQSCPCHLQHGDRLGAIDSREVDQELIESVSCFQIVEEVLHRDASGREHGDATLDPGIRMYNMLFHNSAPRDDECKSIIPLCGSDTAFRAL